MSEERDIVERLKERVVYDATHNPPADPLDAEAASEIQRLRGEVSGWQEIAADRQAAHAALVNESERLRGEVERLRGQVRSAVDGAQPLWSGDVARMKEALATIADGSAPPIPHGHYIAHRRAVDVARVALANLEREG